MTAITFISRIILMVVLSFVKVLPRASCYEIFPGTRDNAGIVKNHLRMLRNASAFSNTYNFLRFMSNQDDGRLTDNKTEGFSIFINRLNHFCHAIF